MTQGVSSIVQGCRAFFATGKTRDVGFRKEQLRALKTAVKNRETKIMEALHADLHKASTESYLSEIGFLYEEIDFALKNIDEWVKPQRVTTSLLHTIGSSRILSEPLGTVLIIAPWNYPFQLLLSPYVGAVSAGNCAVLKPSELAPATSAVMAELVKATFDPGFTAAVEGGVETSTALLEEKWDHIFFTGGTQVGKVIMTAAAKHLTPVTLELGGKSPCIVDTETDLDGTARRIAWGKFLNAGQTCVAPDYLLVPEAKRDKLVERIGHYVKTFFGDNPAESPDYGRIISDRHFSRLSGMIDAAKVALGGKTDPSTRYIAPTVMVGVGAKDKVMEDEIFGPLLPVLTYKTLDDAIRFVNERPKPLALYFFSSNRKHEKQVLNQTSFGGGCVNDTLVHLSNPRMPFGGVGESGMGAYHGKFSFDTFSHRKSVVRRSFLIDPMLRYPPYKDRLGLFRHLMG